MNYYGLFGKESKMMGIAYVPEGTPLFLLPDTGWIDNWQPMVMELREGGFVDYLANNRAWKLFSPKLKDILENSKGDRDAIQWLPVIVRSEDGEERDYFIMHIYEEHDVLDKDKTIYGNSNFIIKPVISQRLAAKHHIFAFIRAGGIRYCFSERVRKKVLAGKCTGVTFEPYAVVN